MSAIAAPPLLTVVIPVYNEKATVIELLRRVQAVPLEKEIVVVDDGSTDGTRDLLTSHLADGRQPNVRLILQPRNFGKGAAVGRGFKEARGRIVLIQDADLELDPMEYARLIEPIERGYADVVYGSRFLDGPRQVVAFWHYLGNKALTLLSNVFTNLNLSDVWTCYKVFKREVLDTIEVEEARFGFEPEVTAKIARGGWRVYEVPVSYYGRARSDGKKIGFKDGVAGVWCTIRYGLRRRPRPGASRA